MNHVPVDVEAGRGLVHPDLVVRVAVGFSETRQDSAERVALCAPLPDFFDRVGPVDGQIDEGRPDRMLPDVRVVEMGIGAGRRKILVPSALHHHARHDRGDYLGDVIGEVDATTSEAGISL